MIALSPPQLQLMLPPLPPLPPNKDDTGVKAASTAVTMTTASSTTTDAVSVMTGTDSARLSDHGLYLEQSC